MNFFEEQHRARRRTGLLVTLYTFAVLGLIAGVYVGVMALLMLGGGDEPEIVIMPTVEQAVGIFLFTAVAVLVVVGGGTAFKIWTLARGGGAEVARDMGGRMVDRATTDAQERRLLNVVDEMAIAAGIPAPEVYILDNEAGLNAFAAGYHPADAVVAVTRGLLDGMSRDELQGVIAHEISHVVNGDMRLNMRLTGVLFGILMIAQLGRIALRAGMRGGGGGRRGKGGGVAVVIGLGMVIGGSIGVLCGRLIQAAVSRQREFLADAAAVQFTRNPRGIGGALARIATAGAGGRLETAQAADAGHFLFASAAASGWNGGLSTHPPLPLRIARILPGGAGESLLADYKAGRVPLPMAIPAEPEPTPPSGDQAKGPLPFDPWRFATGIGVLAGGALAHAHQLRQSLAPALAAALTTPPGALRVAEALVLDDDPTARARQVAVLGEGAEQVEAFATALARLPAPARLDLLNLAAPVLRQVDAAERPAALERLRALVEADGRTDALEVAVLVILERLLMPPASGPWGARGWSWAPDGATTRHLAAALLAVLARVGAPGAPDTQAAAFAAALGASGLFANEPMPAMGEVSKADLPEALRRLAHLPPLDRRGLIEACAVAIGHNGTVNDDETLILRAACEALDVPVPPLLPGLIALDTATVAPALTGG